MKKFIFIILILLPTAIYSQVIVAVKDISAANYPTLTAQIRAVNNSQVVEINQDNLLFQEGPIAHRNYTISAPNNGWQTIGWIPDHNYIGPDSYNGVIVVTVDKSIGTLPVSIGGLEKLIGTFIFKNQSGNRIFDLKFTSTAIGDTNIAALRASYFNTKINDNGSTVPIQIDSISIDNDNFLVEWRGNQFNTKQPPVKIINTDNQVLIRFAPYETGPQSGIFKIHYEGGAVAYIRIQGNKKKIVARTNLKITEPNGGEVFTPCQDTIIRWQGNVKDIHTKVELSYDNGNNWQKIDSTITDEIEWNIPSEKTSENAKLRVSQQFTKDAPHLFNLGNNTTSIDYSFDAKKAVSFSTNSAIFEWDLVKLDNSKTSYNLNTRTNGFNPISIKYISDDKFAVIYSLGNIDSLAIFESGNSNPIYKEGFKDLRPNEIYSIPEKNEYIITPQFSNFFKVYDNQSFQLKQDVIYSQPITDIGIANDTSIIAVSGYDSKVYILKKDDFKIQDTISFFGTLLIDNVSLSSDGKLVGVNSIVGGNEGRTNSMIWDLESKNIITSLNISGSKGIEVGFSPTGNMAIFAYEYQNQINIYDLVTQSQSGVIEAFAGSLTDLDYSSQNNSFLLSSSGAGAVKFVQYLFTFPETDETDGTFRIINPIIVSKVFEFADGYIFNDMDKTFSIEFCNTGEVPLLIEDVFFKDNIHFSLKNYTLPDTVLPGECLNITAIFNPKDTSIVTDSLIFATCSSEFPVLVRGNGLNRNIEYLSNLIDLGEVCIQDTTQITTEIFRNADPVPLLFNKFEIENSNVFFIENYTQDTLLQAGESITATIKASPNVLGNIISNYSVLHSNQDKYKATAQLKVIGIGTYVELSHQILPFIPEQKIRTLTIKNTGQDPVEITGAVLNPITDFKINTALPIFIQPGDSKEIEIEWITSNSDISATLELEAVPCLTQRFVDLVDYNANSIVDINDTDADPLDTTSISISFNTNENASYAGIREFEAIVTIDPKIFIPESAVSEYGEAEIENLGFENDKRLMKLTVNGDFPASGTLAKIIGYPGLSEKTTSLLSFDTENSIFWGESTDISSQTGTFTLLLSCNDQIITHTNAQIENISPNPLINNAIIEIESPEESYFELLVSTSTGRVVQSEKIYLSVGNNIIRFNSSKFDSGNYIISLKKEEIISSKNLIIVR